jgi:dipeptidase D
LVINDNDVSKFTRKVQNAQEKFKDAYGDSEENYTYEITEINPLDQVLSLENTDSIVSLLYTLVNGVYLRDEETGETIATSNIGQISTSNNELKLIICGRSVEKNGLNLLKDSYNIIASLSDTNYSLLNETPLWESKEDNELIKIITDSGKNKYGIEPKILRSFAETENSFFAQNKYLINLVSIKINTDNYITQTQLLLDIIKGEKTAES